MQKSTDASASTSELPPIAQLRQPTFAGVSAPVGNHFERVTMTVLSPAGAYMTAHS